MTENAIETEIESENDHATPLGITTLSPPAIHLQGATKKPEELQRRPSGAAPIRFGIRGGCTRHPSIRWNTPELLKGNKKPRLLPKPLEGRSQPLMVLRTPTRTEFRPPFLYFLPLSLPPLIRIRFTRGRVNHHRPHLLICRFRNRT